MAGIVRSRSIRLGLGLAAAALAAASGAPPAAATLAYVQWNAPDSPIWVARDDGRAPRLLVRDGHDPHVSPDGRTIAYAGRAGLHVIPRTGGRSRLLARNGSFLAWSPDSRTIAAEVHVLGSERTRLVTIAVASGRTRRLATASHGFGASFSPRGEALVYTGGSGVDAGLYTIPAGGGKPTLIVRDSRAFEPLWGRLWIVYARTRLPFFPHDTRKYDLWLVKPGGHRRHQLTHQHPGRMLAGPRPVAWSRNGHRLVADFVGEGTDYAEAVNPFTGKVRRVGKPTGGARGAGIFAAGISRDGAAILGSTGGISFDGDVYALPWRGGRPRLLARHAIAPSWSR